MYIIVIMKGLFVQLISTAILSMPTFFLGFDTALFSFEYMKQILQSRESSVDGSITGHQASLMKYLNVLGCFSSTLIGGNIADAIGRKRMAIICGLLIVLSWSIVTVATNITQILLARCLMGISCGAHTVNVFTYISEYSQTSLRGSLISMVMVAGNTGVLVSYICEYYFSFGVISYIMLMLSVSLVGLLAYPKESSIYLLSRGQYQEALKSLKFYRGAVTTTEIVEEVAYIRSQIYPKLIYSDVNQTKKMCERVHNNNIPNEKISDIQMNPWKILWSTASMRRALVIITLFIVLMTFAGTIAAQSACLLFHKAHSSFSSRVCSIILASAWLLGCVVSAVTSNMIGRRALMMMSSVVSALCLAATASMMKWPWAPVWASPILVLLFCFSFSLGTTNVPFVQLTESFSFEVRSAATVCALCAMWLSHIAGMAVFSPAFDFLGLDGLHVVESIAATLLATLSYCLMRETKDIQQSKIYNKCTNKTICATAKSIRVFEI